MGAIRIYYSILIISVSVTACDYCVSVRMSSLLSLETKSDDEEMQNFVVELH